MTKENDFIYIDEDTYFKIISKEDKSDYQRFLKDNPQFIDVTKKKTTLEKVKQEVISNKEKELEEKHKRADDFRYIMPLIWLEQYLDRYKTIYGEFKYSKDNLTNQEKCEELIKYYEKCGCNRVEEIFKRKPHRGISR